MTQDEQNMLDELLELEGGLYSGELDFIEDLSEDPERRLSEKQSE